MVLFGELLRPFGVFTDGEYGVRGQFRNPRRCSREAPHPGRDCRLLLIKTGRFDSIVVLTGKTISPSKLRESFCFEMIRNVALNYSSAGPAKRCDGDFNPCRSSYTSERLTCLTTNAAMLDLQGYRCQRLTHPMSTESNCYVSRNAAIVAESLEKCDRIMMQGKKILLLPLSIRFARPHTFVTREKQLRLVLVCSIPPVWGVIRCGERQALNCPPTLSFT